jgi:hypothetical protein
VALAVVAALVVVGLAFALNSLSSLGGDGSPAAQPTGGTQQQTGTPSASGEPSAPPESSAPGAAAPTVQGVRTLDPQGDDGTENDETAPRAIDGDPGTAWESSTYSNAEFGNLKDGVGLVVDLGRPSTLSGVTLTVNGSGGQVEVRSASGPGLDGSEVLATEDVGGQPVEVTLEQPVETQYVVLWFTRLPETGAGFRVELAEVQVR